MKRIILFRYGHEALGLDPSHLIGLGWNTKKSS